MNLSSWLMNFLLMLSAYNSVLSPEDDAWEFDYNGNGIIDITDIMDMLSMQPSINKFGLFEER